MELKRCSADALAFVYPDMQRQFPPEERKPRPLLEQLIDQNLYDLIVAYADGTPVGYLLLCPTPYRTVWLDYIAVFPENHSRGYGSKMLQQLSSVYPNNFGCLLEVEQANPLVSDTLRRIRFYEALGCRKYPFYYALPTPDGSFPMDLYLLPWQQTPPNIEAVKESILHAFHTIHQDIPHRGQVYQKILQSIEKQPF